MLTAFILLFLKLFSFDYQNIDVALDAPKEIRINKVVMLSVTINNGSPSNIAFWECQTFESLYRGSYGWNIVIHKDGREYFISQAFVTRIYPFKVIKLKKGEKYTFDIPVLFELLSNNGVIPLDSIESGEYEVQVAVSFKTPKNTRMISNTVKCHLTGDQ